MTARHGDWMQTYSGRVFWPMDPRPEDVCIEDIAHALANQCRFAGHCAWFYSVAQHSVLVANALPSELRLWGLLHDASAAYLVDVPRPVKPHLPGYCEAEERVMRAIAACFDLPWPMPDEVKRIDNAILADEQRALMPNPQRDWALPEPALGIEIQSVEPGEAAFVFKLWFTAITGRACVTPPAGAGLGVSS